MVTCLSSLSAFRHYAFKYAPLRSSAPWWHAGDLPASLTQFVEFDVPFCPKTVGRRSPASPCFALEFSPKIRSKVEFHFFHCSKSANSNAKKILIWNYSYLCDSRHRDRDTQLRVNTGTFNYKCQRVQGYALDSLDARPSPNASPGNVCWLGIAIT